MQVRPNSSAIALMPGTCNVDQHNDRSVGVRCFEVRQSPSLCTCCWTFTAWLLSMSRRTTAQTAGPICHGAGRTVFCTLLAERSRAITVPVSPISCASAVVLPPGAAHMSNTLEPGCGSSACDTNGFQSIHDVSVLPPGAAHMSSTLAPDCGSCVCLTQRIHWVIDLAIIGLTCHLCKCP